MHGTDRRAGVRRRREVSDGSVLYARLVSGDADQQEEVEKRVHCPHSGLDQF